jgi:hypothetical protein
MPALVKLHVDDFLLLTRASDVIWFTFARNLLRLRDAEREVRSGADLAVRFGRAARQLPSPADLRHDNQVVALGPMLSASGCFRFFGKKSQMVRRDFSRTAPETFAMVVGRWWDGSTPSRRLGRKKPHAITTPHRRQLIPRWLP